MKWRYIETTVSIALAGNPNSGKESVSQWAGFDWRSNIALIGGFVAKEVIVSTLGTACSLGDVDPEENRSLVERLASAPGWGKAAAWSLIIFIIF